MSEIQHWIDGSAGHIPAGTRWSDVFNPATGDVTHHVALGGITTVDEAVASAAEASASWSRSSLSQRARILFRFRELMSASIDELAALITAEHGKVRADALGEVQRGLEVIDFACGMPHLLKGAFSESVSTGVDTYSMRQPLGVVAGITPFNFPAMVPMWMYPIAIAAGNAFILKPSERDPSVSMRTAELWSEAGLPAGVFNVVNGDKETVDRLLEHPDVSAVSFVGSTPVARQVYISGSSAGKRVQALGGAKNHMVVLPDADLDEAADSAVSAAYGSAGERCMAISVLVAVGDIGSPLAEAIASRIENLRIGPGTNEGSDLGPLITEAHRERVSGYIDKGNREGAEVLVDGRELSPPSGYEGGFWLGPSLLDHVDTSMTVYRDEIFGPVLSMMRVATLEDALELVNANAYGNGTAIFTRDGGAARFFQREVQVGMVGINVPIPVPMAYYSFGGWKDSLFGASHIHGEDGVRFYTRDKVVTTRWRATDTGIAMQFPSG